MPKYQPTNVAMTTTPMPTPPAPPGMPRDALASRSSSTLLLRRKSSVRIVHTRDLSLKLDLKGVRNLSSVFRKLDHDLLVQPDIHRRRIICCPGMVQFFGSFFARRVTVVEFEKFHELNDRPSPV